MAVSKDRRYRAAVGGIRRVVHILLLLLLVIFLFFLGRTAYHYGYAVFNETGAEAAPGKDVTVAVRGDMSAGELAEVLSQKGLIKEVPVFLLQERISGMHEMYVSGTYKLNTSMTPTEILRIITGEAEEKNG